MSHTLIRACGEAGLADELSLKYKAGERMYAPLKETAADVVSQLTNRMKARREQIATDRKEHMKRVYEMCDDARDMASMTLKEVRRLTGLPKQYMFFQYPHRKAKRESQT